MGKKITVDSNEDNGLEGERMAGRPVRRIMYVISLEVRAATIETNDGVMEQGRTILLKEDELIIASD